MPKSSSRVAVSAVISASPAACYNALADYKVAHPQIVPPRYFGPLVVVHGGVGAGTRTTCSMKLLGREVPFTSDMTEPVPGQVLVETILESGVVTTFTVVNDGSGNARVTIETRLPPRGGLSGIIERWVTRKYFPGIYTEELGRLANYVNGSVLGVPQTLLEV